MTVKSALLIASLALLFPFSEASPQDPEQFDAWIGFSDKGIRSEAQRRDALSRLEETFDSAALARRRSRRTLPGLFDDHDIPLAQEYLDAVAATGAELRVQSRWLNGVTVLATTRQLGTIRTLPFVAEVDCIHRHAPRSSRQDRAPSDPDLKRGPPPKSGGRFGWSAGQLRQIEADRLHEAGFRGEGIRIGVVDTGFLLSHPAFRSPAGPIRVLAQWDFMDNDSNVVPEPGDSPRQHEHGTLVLGTLAANRPGELMGSAPAADYILLKAEDDATEYFLEERWFAAALEFAEAHGADIVSSSVVLYEGYGSDDVDGTASVMAQAWRLAIGNGVIGLQGGGNSGFDEDPETHHLLPPAGVPDVITVGAVNEDNRVATFSSDGLRIDDTVKPELLAWGKGTATVSPYEPGGYTTSAGTSMATPVLAGGVACLLQAHPDWSVREIRTALFQSGDLFRSAGMPDPLFVRGYGIPNLAQAAGLGSGDDQKPPGPLLESFDRGMGPL